MRWRAAWPFALALALPARAAVEPMPGTEVLVAGGLGIQTEPAVAFPYVAFVDFSTGSSRVSYFDANGNGGAGARTPVGGDSGPQTFPSIAAGVIAFTQGAGSAARIVRYEIPTGTLSSVASSPGPQANACISQNVVAWEDGSLGATVIWVADVFQGGARAISGPGPQVTPRCNGPRVVYVNQASGSSVQLFDLTTGATTTVHPGPAESADVDQDVVALSSTAADLGDIEVVSVTGDVLATLPLAGRQSNPHVSGDWVAFEDWSTGTSLVTLWNWVLGGLYAPPAVNAAQRLNDLEWPNVVYADYRSGDPDVYLFETAFVPPPPPDGGTDGGADGGVDGGTDGGVDGGEDGGVDGGVDGGTDGGTDGGVDGGTDGGVDGGTDGGVDGGVDGGADGGPDAGPDGGPDGGPHAAACGDPNAIVLADLRATRTGKDPDAASTEFRAPRESRVLVCIDPDRVSSAWVLLDREAVATPRDFDPHVTHLERRGEVEEGKNRLGVVIAGTPGASIHVRILLDPGRECDDDAEGGEHRHRHGKWEGPSRHHGELLAATDETPDPAQGCGTTGAGLLGLPLAGWLGRRRRGAAAPPL